MKIALMFFGLLLTGMLANGCGPDSAGSQSSTASPLVLVWDGQKYPPEDLQGPAGFKVTPLEAYIAVLKSEKLSPIVKWACYADGQMYYICDAFLGTPSPKNALRVGVRVDGQTGDVKGKGSQDK